MRIRKLELFGFKSFPDRTVFEFGSGISCVVGPNGSGKSNVVDALRWCIGEQSARSLRGQDMVDVIFAGSAERSPVGFAEVTLTLAADGGEPFPGDWSRFEELEVGRRLYRDGTSEYLVNRVKCRRRDVVDLFLDTGVGANLYSFIAQGQVDRIVSQSPSERRVLIDEAAGISRYKARRDEALARLTATGAQLDRAADVADEMGARLAVLERQVVRAGQFRRARARIRQLEIALGVVKYAALAADRRALREELRRAQDECGALKRAIERQESDLAERAAEVEAVRDAVATWREEVATLEARRREAEGARDLHRGRHDELLATAERARVRMDDATDAIAREVAARDEASALVRSLEAELDPARVSVERRARDRAHEASVALRAQLAALQAREAAREERVRAAAEELERLDARLATLAGSDPPAPEDGPVREALARALAERDVARDAMAVAERALAAAIEAVRAEEAADASRRAAADAARVAWERRVDEVTRRRRGLTQWADRVRAAALARADAEARAARAGIDARARDWADALRGRATVTRASEARSERARSEAWRAELAERERALDAAEAEGLAAARASVDREPLRRAIDAEQEAIRALASAERARADAIDVDAGLRGAAAALEAEWRALEARRQADVPAAWASAPLLGREDPRARARPELASLPRVEPDALDPPTGRAVLARGGVTWIEVADRDGARAALAAGSLPVVALDGSVRVDADGVVELGWRREDRWVDVQEELAELRPRAGRAAEARAAAESDAVVCRERLDAARAERVRVEREVGVAEAAALTDARAAARAAREAHVQAVRREEASARAALDSAREASERALQVALQEVDAARVAALAEVVPRRPVEALTRAIVAVAWPADPPRPEPASPSAVLTVARERVQRAEGALAGCRAAWTAAVDAVEQATARVAGVQRLQAEHAARAVARDDEIAAIRARRASVEQIGAGPSEAQALLETAALSASRDEALAHAEARLRDAETAAAAARERSFAASERVERAVAAIARAQAAHAEASAERAAASAAAAEAWAAAEQAEAHAAQLAVERAASAERASRDRDRLARLQAEHEKVRVRVASDRQRVEIAESGRASSAQRVDAIQGEIEALRARLGDRYQVSIPGLLDRLWMQGELVLEADEAVASPLRIGEVSLPAVEPLTVRKGLLDDEDAVVASVGALEQARAELTQLGEVNLAAEEEYRDLHARWSDLDAQRADLQASVDTLRAAIAKTNRICRERFRDAYDRVNEAFQASYPRLVGGGDARLALTDEDDLLETGVDIFVRPPGKRLQNLSLLSGGEKAMTAIALLLALFQVRPSPFCVLDEVDAPLDEANGGRFNDMVREMSRVSQFIVITHNRRTMECADVLYGVTMARPGVSTLVSVSLERRG